MTRPLFTGPGWATALRHLEESPRYRFSAGLAPEVPLAAAGVYAIWDGDILVYVGMSGRRQSAETLRAHREAAPGTAKGLADRLRAHGAGRRSGDQFCVYVCDRLVLPTLTPQEVAEVAAGTLSLDKRTRELIHTRFAYSFVEVPDGRAALELERLARTGSLAGRRPLLNPGDAAHRPWTTPQRRRRNAANARAT